MAGSKTINGGTVDVKLIWDGTFDQGKRNNATIDDKASTVAADLNDKGRLVFHVTIPNLGDGLPMPGTGTLTGVTVTITDINV
jgi:hypothetical protein